MKARNADLVLKYALAAAGQEDFGSRELGPIHLIKYVYLADLAFAEKHGGQTFTGASWRFHHFGPWAAEVHQRIGPVVKEIMAVERCISSAVADDAVRWSVDDDRLFDELGDQLPPEVSRAVRQAVHRFGQDTSTLLHFVYTTKPMLQAAPGELLVFDHGDREPPGEATRSPSQVFARTLDLVSSEVQSAAPEHGWPLFTNPPSVSSITSTPELISKVPKAPSKAKERGHAQKLQALREAVRAKLKGRSHKPGAMPVPHPRYDEVYANGVEWLDEQAGETINLVKGEMIFSDDVWKSRGRGDPNLS